MVGTDTSSDGDLEVLRLGETLSGEVTRVESAMLSAQNSSINSHWEVVRGGDDDFSINELLVELAVLALLVGGGHESVALVLNPFPETKLVLGGTQQLWLLLGVLKALVAAVSNCF